MPNPGSILGQIGESFEEIGKDVVSEAVQAPKDIAGKALESLGVTSRGKNPKQQSKTAPQVPGQEEIPQVQDHGPSEEAKRAIARAALEEISGKKPQQKEPGVWERLQKEEEEKKEQEKKKKEAVAKQSLPQSSSKRPRGDLYGLKAKKANVENKGKRQD